MKERNKEGKEKRNEWWRKRILDERKEWGRERKKERMMKKKNIRKRTDQSRQRAMKK